MREWLPDAMTLPNEYKPRLVAIIRAKLAKRSDAAKAEKLRAAMKRLTDGYTWGGVDESDYRSQLKRLQTDLAAAMEQPEEHRMLAAVKLAQNLPTLWDAASPERRKELFWSMFEKATVKGRRIVSVRPRPEIAPLLALNARSSSAVPTGFEPAISSLTGTYARPLHHGTVPEIRAFSHPHSPVPVSILPPSAPEQIKRRRVRFLSLAAPAGVANVDAG